MVKLFQNPILFFILIFLASCASSRGLISADVLLKADADFSALSQQNGLRAAFLQYVDDSAVLLKEAQYPIIGAAARRYYQQLDSVPFALTWQLDSGNSGVGKK